MMMGVSVKHEEKHDSDQITMTLRLHTYATTTTQSNSYDYHKRTFIVNIKRYSYPESLASYCIASFREHASCWNQERLPW